VGSALCALYLLPLHEADILGLQVRVQGEAFELFEIYFWISVNLGRERAVRKFVGGRFGAFAGLQMRNAEVHDASALFHGLVLHKILS